MKVLHAVYGLGLGGVERSAQNFALATQGAGHETTVVALTDGPRRSRLEQAGVHVLLPEDLSRLPKQDVIGLNSHGLPEAFVRDLLNRHRGASVWEKNVFSTPSPWMDTLDVSFQLSPWAHWLYLKRGGDSTRSSTLSNPIEVTPFWFDAGAGSSFRRRYAIPTGSLVLGRVGQPLAMKWNPRIYADVCDVVDQQVGTHLLLVGAPREIADIVKQRLSPNRFTMIDRIESDEGLRAAYSSMNLFVHAARQGESFGNVIAEAALCEVPSLTIATPWADNSQGFVAGPSGRVASARKDFRYLLSTSLENPGSLREQGTTARGYIVENFAAAAVTSEVISVAIGDQEPRGAPDLSMLATPTFLGNSPPTLTRRVLNSSSQAVLLGSLTGQESWAWLATTKLNSWGISRHGFRTTHDR